MSFAEGRRRARAILEAAEAARTAAFEQEAEVMKEPIELGNQVEDKVSGFVGYVTGIVNYITGCRQALVAPRVDKEGKRVEAEWFDVQRLDVRTSGDPLNLVEAMPATSTPGFDKPAPRQ